MARLGYSEHCKIIEAPDRLKFEPIITRRSEPAETRIVPEDRYAALTCDRNA